MGTFGQRFKELRIEKNFKQQELADDFNKIFGYTFSKSSISHYENGKRRPETDALIDFASYFNVSIDYLVGLSDNKKLDKPNEDINLLSEAINAVNKVLEDNNTTQEDKNNLFKIVSDTYFKNI